VLVRSSPHEPTSPQVYTPSLHDALPISRALEAAEGGSLLEAKHRLAVVRAVVDREAVALTVVFPPHGHGVEAEIVLTGLGPRDEDRKSTRLNSSHVKISYAVFCLKKKNK